MAAPRPPKGRKTYSDNASPVQGSRGGRGSAWRSSGGPNFGNNSRQSQNPTGFPPLATPNQRSESAHEQKLLSTLTTLVDQIVIITQKSGARHEGTLCPIPEGEVPHVSLKNVRDLSNQSSAPRESMIFSVSMIVSCMPKATNGTDGFRTDTDISNTANGATSKERELERWQPDAPLTGTAASLAALQGDEATFGPAGGYSGVPWDQFEVNEQRFGVTTSFDEEAYTTKLDRSAPGYKERERKAQQIANEIMSGTSNNPHIAEERIMNGATDGIGEEEKYSAVVRTPGAYVPPGARRNGTTPGPTNNGPVPASSPGAAPASAQSQATAPAQTAPTTNGTPAPVPTISTPATEDAAAQPPAAGLVANFRDFVTNEKQRLAQRKQAMVKTEMDKRKADLLKFSKNFKLSRPIPDDLVPILAKDEEKQKAIVEKAKAEAEAVKEQRAAAIANPSTSGPSGATKAPNSSDSVAKPAVKPAAAVAAPDAAKKGKGGMFIQAIPPFNKDKLKKSAPSGPGTPPTDGVASAHPTPGPSATPNAVPASPASVQAQANSRLNANASIFKPNANAPVFKPISPGQTPAQKAKEPLKDVSNTPAVAATATVTGPPNPFYGARVPAKKGASVHLKEDFNPFRHSKVADASQVSSIWPYNGKRYAALHPMIPPIHAAPGPTVPNPQLPIQPLPQHEEHPNQDPSRGMPPQQPPQPQHPQAQAQPPYPIMYYPQYSYSPAPHGQQQMMMPPGSPFMPGYHMQPVPYPHHMPPSAPPMYGHPPPGMPGVSPTPHYMPQPPYGQTSPPPTGTPRGPGPMPPHQMPPAFYHHSPQLTHAMPYPGMQMMPPQGHFDPSAQPPPVSQQQTPMGH